MKLLVSVRSAMEAREALAGGADLIDIKDPARGSLGRADDDVMNAVLEAVAGRVPVSAALGELIDNPATFNPKLMLAYGKFGLAGCSKLPWRKNLDSIRKTASTVIVPTAYADFEQANSPPVEEVVAFVADQRYPVLLLDTWCKDGRTLFDWVTERQLTEFVEKLNWARSQLALAGSLGAAHVSRVGAFNPGWLAVRGAVCSKGNRTGDISRELVRAMKELAMASTSPSES